MSFTLYARYFVSVADMLFTCYLLFFQEYKDSHKFVNLKVLIWLTEILYISDHTTLGLLDLARFSADRGLALKREQEKAGTQCLLEHLLGSSPFELLYTDQKKPYLMGHSVHLSISHSHDRLAILLEKRHSTGVDIELKRSKVLAVRHKFLSAAEWEWAGDDTEKLTTLWAAKEAMYKAYGLKGINFASDLSVEPGEGDSLTGHLRRGALEQSWQLQRLSLANYVLVYIFNELPARPQ